MWVLIHPHQRSWGELNTPYITTTSTRKKRRVIVVGDSLLKGTEGPICRTDPSHWEVCCLPGARVRHITRKLPSLVQPITAFPCGWDEVAVHSPRMIKGDFRALGQLVRESGAQVIFSPSSCGW